MTPKPHRDPDADAAMLGYLTGLSAAICKAWLEAPTFKSAEAIKAALLPDGDDHLIATVRSEIEAYALARVKNEQADGLGVRNLHDMTVSRSDSNL
jgi:hypothetical protein